MMNKTDLSQLSRADLEKRLHQYEERLKKVREARKQKVSLTLDFDVVDALDQRARELNISRSEMINSVLREKINNQP